MFYLVFDLHFICYLIWDKLKSAAKYAIGLNLRSLSGMVGNDRTNFLHNLLLTNKQVFSLHKAFGKSLSKDIKLSKAQLLK